MSTRKRLETAIEACAGERIVEFEDSIRSLLASKLLTALERRKPEVAERMFSDEKKSSN